MGVGCDGGNAKICEVRPFGVRDEDVVLDREVYCENAITNHRKTTHPFKISVDDTHTMEILQPRYNVRNLDAIERASTGMSRETDQCKARPSRARIIQFEVFPNATFGHEGRHHCELVLIGEYAITR